MTLFLHRCLAGLLALAAGAVAAQDGKLYTPGPFDRVIVSGVARVDLQQGPQDQVFVVGDDSAQRSVQLRVTNGRLVIDTEDGWKFWNREGVQLRIQVRDLSQLAIAGASEVIAAKAMKLDDLRVQISGQGSVRLADVTAHKLRFDITGAGDGDLAGKVEDLVLRVSGKGKLAAERLRAGRAAVHISGVGQADVWAVEDLDVVVSGIGSVNYWGQPRVRRTMSGMGDVNAKGERK